MDRNYRKVLDRAIATYGVEAQEKMVLEEMSELQKEICKRWRGNDNLPELAEEIADVEIMLDQLKMIHGIEDAVDTYKQEKVERLKRRLDHE